MRLLPPMHRCNSRRSNSRTSGLRSSCAGLHRLAETRRRPAIRCRAISSRQRAGRMEKKAREGAGGGGGRHNFARGSNAARTGWGGGEPRSRGLTQPLCRTWATLAWCKNAEEFCWSHESCLSQSKEVAPTDAMRHPERDCSDAPPHSSRRRSGRPPERRLVAFAMGSLESGIRPGCGAGFRVRSRAPGRQQAPEELAPERRRLSARVDHRLRRVLPKDG